MNLMISDTAKRNPMPEKQPMPRDHCDRSRIHHKVAQELVKAEADRGEIDLILVSPYLRTQQTADIVMDNLGRKPLRKLATGCFQSHLCKQLRRARSNSVLKCDAS